MRIYTQFFLPLGVVSLATSAIIFLSSIPNEVGATPTIRENSIRLCGTRLITFMKKFCRGCFNGLEGDDSSLDPVSNKTRNFSAPKLVRIKRSFSAAHQIDQTEIAVHKPVLRSDSLDDDETQFEMDQSNLSSNPSRDRRHLQLPSRGIADECCLNKCTYAVLESYCC